MRRSAIRLGAVAVVLAIVGWRAWAAEEAQSPPATAASIAGAMPWME